LQLRVRGFGFGRGKVRLGLIDLRLELHLFDLVQQVARLEVLSLAEGDFFEKALDPRPDINLVGRLDVTDELEGLADASFIAASRTPTAGLAGGAAAFFFSSQADRSATAKQTANKGRRRKPCPLLIRNL